MKFEIEPISDGKMLVHGDTPEIIEDAKLGEYLRGVEVVATAEPKPAPKKARKPRGPNKPKEPPVEQVV